MAGGERMGKGVGSEKILSQRGDFDGFLIQSLGNKDTEDSILHIPTPAPCLSHNGHIPRLFVFIMILSSLI